MKRPLPKNDLAEHIRQGTIKPVCYEEYLRSLPSPGPGAAVFGDEEYSRTYDAIMARETRELEGSQGVAATQKDEVRGVRKAAKNKTAFEARPQARSCRSQRMLPRPNSFR